MREIAIYSAIGLWMLVLFVLSVVTVNYRITRRFLRISWLGIPIRWVRLRNISKISVQRLVWAEKWYNSLKPANRYLLIRKNFGIFFNHLVITPKNHMIFKAELEKARAELLANASGRASRGVQAVSAAKHEAPVELAH